jgi:hypothetical protein
MRSVVYMFCTKTDKASEPEREQEIVCFALKNIFYDKNRKKSVPELSFCT